MSGRDARLSLRLAQPGPRTAATGASVSRLRSIPLEQSRCGDQFKSEASATRRFLRRSEF